MDPLAIGVFAGIAALVAGGVLSAAGSLRPGLGLQAAAIGVLGVVGVAVLVGGETHGAPFTSTIGLAFGLDPLSGFFLAVLALTAVPALAFARRLSARAQRRPERGRAHGVFLLSLVGVLAARDVISFLGVLGAHDARAGGRDPPRTPRGIRSLGRLRVHRDHPPRRGRRMDRAARARQPRGDRRSVGSRRRRERRPDPRCDRGADRLRHQGGLRAAAFLAPAGTPGGSLPSLRTHVGDDDQGRDLRPDPGRVPVARLDTAMARI